mmetsp:Transcript_15720/g.34946  ORF Transcript_15720/g.34946 Transcript_15720/m.34946 type:complete len:211 (-) Transcript_15720:1161-1793(-)
MSLAAICSRLCSMSPIVVADNGSSRIRCIFRTILSIGCRTSRFASRENKRFPSASTTHKNSVCSMDNPALNWLKLRISNTRTNLGTVVSCKNIRGATVLTSVSRRPSGHFSSPNDIPTKLQSHSPPIEPRGCVRLRIRRGSRRPVPYWNNGSLKVLSHEPVLWMLLFTSGTCAISCCPPTTPIHNSLERKSLEHLALPAGHASKSPLGFA